MNNFSIQNAKTLNSYAQNVVRHLRNNDNKRAFENFETLIKEGTHAPGYTRSILMQAKFDNAKYLSNLVAEGELQLTQAMNTNKKTILAVAKFWQMINGSNIDKDFKLSFAQLYPKSAQHRLAIEPYLQEGSRELQNCSNKKFYKKLLYLFLKWF